MTQSKPKPRRAKQAPTKAATRAAAREENKETAKAARRVAVYAATRDRYETMLAAARSLADKTRMDRIILLTDGADIPEALPPYIDVIDVSGQKWFPPGGPNYGSRWTWMSLMRLAIPRLLPEERRVLYLDCDTIVRQDIGELFDLDLGGCLLAAVLEPDKSRDGRRYYNAGVLLMDLDALRASGKVAEMVSAANYRRWGLPDQDVLNACCSRQTLALAPAYNATGFIPHDEERVKIRHYAGTRDKMAEAELQEALRLPWRDWGAGA